jgi:hypothetical protein
VPLKLAVLVLLLAVLMSFLLAALALLADAAAFAVAAGVTVFPLLRGRRIVLRACAAALAALSRLFLWFLLALRILLRTRGATLNVWLAVSSVVLLSAAGVLIPLNALGLGTSVGIWVFSLFLGRFRWHLVFSLFALCVVLPLTISRP